MKTLPEYEVHAGKKYPVLKRRHGYSQTEACPFCGRPHYHGTGEGHRMAHCSQHEKPEGIQLSNGSFVPVNDGYILREF